MAKIKILQDDLSKLKKLSLSELADEADRKGAKIEVEGDYTFYTVRDEKLEIETAKYVVSEGADVLDFELFIEVTPEDTVPTGVYGATWTDEEGTEQTHTWLTWAKPNCQPIERAGKYYVATRAHTGSDLNMSDLKPVFGKLVKVSDLPKNEVEE